MPPFSVVEPLQLLSAFCNFELLLSSAFELPREYKIVQQGFKHINNLGHEAYVLHSLCIVVAQTNRLTAAATNKHCWLSDGNNIRVLRQRASISGMILALHHSDGSRVGHCHMVRFHGLESPHLPLKELLTRENLKALSNTQWDKILQYCS